MKKITTLTVLLFITLLAFGQDFKYVNTETLNVRESAGKHYNVVGQVHKGDRVIARSENSGWTEIETESGAKGFVATEYLSSESIATNVKIQEPEQTGFKYGFKKAFTNFFIVSLLVFAGIEYYRSKRIKDRRYRKGYKELPFTTFEVVKFAFYSTAVCSVVGLIMGIFYWLKSF